MMTFTKNHAGLNMGIIGMSAVGRMYAKQDPEKNNRHVLCLEIKDVGPETFEMALAAFRYARATGVIPILDPQG